MLRTKLPHLKVSPVPAQADGPGTAAKSSTKKKGGGRRLLVRRKGAARLCDVSLATWDRLDSAGKTPAAVRLGGAKLYRVAELKAWARHGCPPRAEWGPIWELLCRTGGR